MSDLNKIESSSEEISYEKLSDAKCENWIQGNGSDGTGWRGTTYDTCITIAKAMLKHCGQSIYELGLKSCDKYPEARQSSGFNSTLSEVAPEAFDSFNVTFNNATLNNSTAGYDENFTEDGLYIEGLIAIIGGCVVLGGAVAGGVYYLYNRQQDNKLYDKAIAKTIDKVTP